MEASPSKRIHKEVSLQTKYMALLELESGKTNKEVCLMFEVPSNTISTWKKNKSKIFEAFRNGSPASKRLRVDKFDQINKAVLQWFHQMQLDNVIINRPLVREKALSFAKEMGVENFHASNGWLEKWKKRYNVSFKTASEAAKAETDGIMPPSIEATLPMLLSRYTLKEIFNAKEFGLFYQCLPGTISHLAEENCADGKHSSSRLTVVAVANAFGERMEIFVIGKPANPSSSEDVKNIPCRYRSQRKSWMDSSLFEEWVRELDTKFGESGRKVALIVSDSSAHPDIDGLQWVELIFVPPKTDSMTQPMDQGIVKYLKTKFRSLQVKKQILDCEKFNELSKFSIPAIMAMLLQAWHSIPFQTFTSSFRKAGLVIEATERISNDHDDEFVITILNELEANLLLLKEKFGLDYKLSAEQLINIDSQVSVTGTLSDADIIAGVYGNSVDLSDDEPDQPQLEEKIVLRPSKNSVSNAIKTLEDYSVFSKFGTDIITALKQIQRAVDLDNQLINSGSKKIEE